MITDGEGPGGHRESIHEVGMMMSEGLSVPECGALAVLAYQELTSSRLTEKV